MVWGDTECWWFRVSACECAAGDGCTGILLLVFMPQQLAFSTLLLSALCAQAR